MSRTTTCDGCGQPIAEVDDRAKGQKPPITMRGPEGALDFHDVSCVLTWAQRRVAADVLRAERMSRSR